MEWILVTYTGNPQVSEQFYIAETSLGWKRQREYEVKVDGRKWRGNSVASAINKPETMK